MAPLDKGYFADYERAWKRVTAGWSNGNSFSRTDLQMWRTYSANYLFRQAEIVWAVDPFLPHAKLGRPYPGEIPPPLRQLDVILLSHRHGDHWDSHLLERLSSEAIQWLVPPFLRDEIVLAHLNELSRSATDIWTSRHAEMLQARLKSLAPEIAVRAPGLLEIVRFSPPSCHEKP